MINMDNFRLLLRFLAVGGSTTLLFLSLVYVLVEYAHLHPTLASTLGCVVAICYNYTLHYLWTFASDAPHGRVLVRYLFMNAGGVEVNAIAMHLGTSLLPLHYLVVQLLVGIVVVIWNVSVSMLWVYREN